MRKPIAVLVMALAAGSCTQSKPLDVKDVWTRESVAKTTNAAVYMTIESPAPDRLVAAWAPVAAKTDLMTMTGGTGSMRMVYLEGINIPANKRVSLNSSGLHVWLADLKRPLVAGETFPLTLRFERAGERVVSVSVIEASAMPAM